MSKILDNLLKYDKAQKYICWDVETANLNLLTNNLPWQLGFVIGNRDGILEEHNIYIKWPNLRMSVDAARITRYNPRIVEEKGLDPKKALDIFESYIYNPNFKVSGFNILNFDVFLHNLWRKELGIASDYSYIGRCLDARSLYIAYKLGIKFKESDNFYLLQKKILNFHERGFKNNLAHCCREFGIDVDDTKTHDGVYDTILTHQLTIELLKKLDL